MVGGVLKREGVEPTFGKRRGRSRGCSQFPSQGELGLFPFEGSPFSGSLRHRGVGGRSGLEGDISERERA